MPDTSLLLDRSALAAVFKDQRTMLAFEAVMRAALIGLPDQITDLTSAEIVTTSPDPGLPSARVLTGSAGLTVDASVANVVSLILNVIAALGFTPAKNSETFVVASASGDLSAERVLTGSTGVTIDTATAGLIKVLVNVATALGYTPANQAGDTFTGPVDVNGQLTCNALRIDNTPGASVATATHSLLINLNGVGYYVLLSSTP